MPNIGNQILTTGVVLVSSATIEFQAVNGLFAVNGTVIRNRNGEGCPFQHTFWRVVGPRSAGFIPGFVARRLPVVSLYGAGIGLFWDGIDRDYVLNIKRAANHGFAHTTLWVESLTSPLQLSATGNATMSVAPQAGISIGDIGTSA